MSFRCHFVLRLFVRLQVVTRIAKANFVTAEHFEVELEVFFCNIFGKKFHSTCKLMLPQRDTSTSHWNGPKFMQSIYRRVGMPFREGSEDAVWKDANIYTTKRKGCWWGVNLSMCNIGLLCSRQVGTYLPGIGSWNPTRRRCSCCSAPTCRPFLERETTFIGLVYKWELDYSYFTMSSRRNSMM